MRTSARYSSKYSVEISAILCWCRGNPFIFYTWHSLFYTRGRPVRRPCLPRGVRLVSHPVRPRQVRHARRADVGVNRPSFCPRSGLPFRGLLLPSILFFACCCLSLFVRAPDGKDERPRVLYSYNHRSKALGSRLFKLFEHWPAVLIYIWGFPSLLPQPLFAL